MLFQSKFSTGLLYIDLFRCYHGLRITVQGIRLTRESFIYQCNDRKIFHRYLSYMKNDFIQYFNLLMILTEQHPNILTECTSLEKN